MSGTRPTQPTAGVGWIARPSSRCRARRFPRRPGSRGPRTRRPCPRSPRPAPRRSPASPDPKFRQSMIASGWPPAHATLRAASTRRGAPRVRVEPCDPARAVEADGQASKRGAKPRTAASTPGRRTVRSRRGGHTGGRSRRDCGRSASRVVATCARRLLVAADGLAPTAPLDEVGLVHVAGRTQEPRPLLDGERAEQTAVAHDLLQRSGERPQPLRVGRGRIRPTVVRCRRHRCSA